LAGLARGGRAEATLRYELPGPPGAPPRPIRATLALERPTLARLDVRTTGESVTLRADGGEWLQPAARQLVRLQPAQAIAALRWWRVLLAGGAEEQRLGPAEYRLLVPGTPEAPADSADVRLDARGLPERLALADGLGGEQVYRLSGWRFGRARGEAAFRLAAPAGWDVVDLP
ncbi:MAG TPA: hypothetical protein VGU27_11805, partial [Candidatus Eisenbacteria bacterium]|nr:hypothetical protein [Candidatus Eisenbacteria bacterium]